MPKDPILDRVIIQLSQSDVLTFRALTSGGCLTLGGLGTGKSSSVGAMTLRSMLNGPYGGLILSVKSSEPAVIKKLIREAARERDLVEFGPEHSTSFDPLAYMAATGTKSALTESIVELFNDLQAVGKVYQPSSGEKYFQDATAELVRAIVAVLINADVPISISKIYEIACSLPETPEQIDNEAWQQSSECAQIIAKLRERRNFFSPQVWSDLDIAIIHLLKRFPTLDPRTRSNIESTLTSLCSKFLYQPYKSLYCSGRFDFSVDDTTHNHKIILASMPLLDVGRETGRLFQVLLRLIFQKFWLRHQYEPGCCHGAFLYIDEASFLMSRADILFHMVCRSSAIAPILLMQNILGIAGDEFGEQTPGSRTLGFLGLIGTKIFLANNETSFTNNYASDLIGKVWRDVSGWNSGHGDQHQHFGVSASQQLVHLVEPIEFTRLMRPDGENPICEAIVHNGSSFNATKTHNDPQGLPYLRVHFSRE